MQLCASRSHANGAPVTVALVDPTGTDVGVANIAYDTNCAPSFNSQTGIGIFTLNCP